MIIGKRFRLWCAIALLTVVLWGGTGRAGAAQDPPSPQVTPAPEEILTIDAPREAADEYVPGQTYWGRNAYIEYIAGSLPIIISAPHGGYLTPAEIPDRTWGSAGRDYHTQESTRLMLQYITAMTGRQPHVIINHLARIKLDANRGIEEAAQGDPHAEQAWHEYHGFIEVAKAAIEEHSPYERGFYFDIHCNDHAAHWVEFGYGLTSADLDRSDEALDCATYRDKSSIKTLANMPGVYFPGVLRGQMSLGGMLMDRYGFKSVPSPTHPDPDGADYWSGGYNTIVHGSRHGGNIDGVQVETYYGFLHNDSIEAYSYALAETIVTFVEAQYGFNLREWPVHLYLPFAVQSSGSPYPPRP
jgi:hypothetical protein